MRNKLRTEDIEVFSEAITHYFTTSTGEPAQVRSAYLIEPGAVPPPDEFTGLIDVSGDFLGSICFSAPRALLSHLLLRMGESVFTDDRHDDIVGEIANTLSGRARRHFGEGLRIAPPRSLAGVGGLPAVPPGCRPYAIPLRWHGYEARLVVQLEASS